MEGQGLRFWKVVFAEELRWIRPVDERLQEWHFAPAFVGVEARGVEVR